MAQTLECENAAFWLPSSFLTDEDEFVFSKSSLVSALSSASDKDDDFVTELSRQLAHSSLHSLAEVVQKQRKLSTSPQSTLTGFGAWTSRSGYSSNGSPNGGSTPPLTPPSQNDVAWDLLYEAAGQVARLKINALINQQNRGLLSAPRNVSYSSKPLHHNSYDFPQYEQVKRQGNGILSCHHHNHNQRSCNIDGPPLALLNSAWPPRRPNNHHHHHRSPNGSIVGMHSVYNNGLGLGPQYGPMEGKKRQCAGTGVFLPRRAGDIGTTTTPSATHKIQQVPVHESRTTECGSMWIPARAVDVLDMECEEVKNGVTVNRRNRFGSGLLSEQEIIMARRNAVVMEHQRRSLMRNDEIRLPSDWTY